MLHKVALNLAQEDIFLTIHIYPFSMKHLLFTVLYLMWVSICTAQNAAPLFLLNANKLIPLYIKIIYTKTYKCI
jgi:hypothetical protein